MHPEINSGKYISKSQQKLEEVMRDSWKSPPTKMDYPLSDNDPTAPVEGIFVIILHFHMKLLGNEGPASSW